VGRLFGTDGVRGLANAELTAELALDVAVAAAHVLVERRTGGSRPAAVVGRDPRASGEFLEAAVLAGLASAGVDVHRVGVVPTPAVAHLTATLGADLGVMISASHNPMPDNGIKFFDSAGFKLPDAIEDEVESRLREGWARPTGSGVGRLLDSSAALDRYIDHLVGTVPRRLEGLRVVVDCANGAASTAAPTALARAGAEVTALHATPDGYNINEGCGSTHPAELIATVRSTGADVGIAHDGDADRCIAIDAEGNVIDGDTILAVCALARHAAGTLAGDTVVTTVMTNLGFHQAMRAAGIGVVETAVGDRYVLEAMRAHGLVLGGEQSGHLVFLDHATTGDGILTALQLLAELAGSGRTLAELATAVRPLPQVLLNLRVADRETAMASPALAATVQAARAELGAEGRILVRASGTEPLVRIMVEAATERRAQEIAARIARTLPDPAAAD